MALEKFAVQHGIKIKQYHADNGRFVDNAFIYHCEANRQHISYCGVSAHFQNGITKRAIRDLQDQAWKQLLHTKGQWPKALHLALWPFALGNAVHLHNTLPTEDENWSRLKKFLNINMGTRLTDIHTFVAPSMPCKMHSREDPVFLNGILGVDLGST